MKIVFVSNYYNHHQAPFSEYMAKRDGVLYTFIETGKISEERKKLGYHCPTRSDFIKQIYLSKERFIECLNLINEADVVIYGSAPERFFKERLKTKKLTFKYAERIYKTGFKWWQQPLRFVKNLSRGWSKKNHYLLCASAYSYADFSKTFNFHNRAYNWGYFPQLKRYDDFDLLINGKEKNSILWAGRFIEWKHPESAINVAEKLKKEGYSFNLKIIGTDILEEEIKKSIEEKGLNDCVKMLGSMKPEQVRDYMEKSEIFLFTSDFNEGWGAVLNESMNSACAVVASHAIGSVPLLVEDGKNGFIYKNGNEDDLFLKTKFLLDNPEKRVEVSKKAYRTISEKWNAEVAAERFLSLVNGINGGEKKPDLYADGPCSSATKLKNGWKK